MGVLLRSLDKRHNSGSLAFSCYLERGKI